MTCSGQWARSVIAYLPANDVGPYWKDLSGLVEYRQQMLAFGDMFGYRCCDDRFGASA